MKHHKRLPQVEEEESVFISMTDMAISFLFIMIILLAFFASEFHPERVVDRTLYENTIKKLNTTTAEKEALQKRLEDLEKQFHHDQELVEYLSGISEDRLRIMREMQKRLIETTGLAVQLDPINGILRFSGDDLFKSGAWKVNQGSTADLVAGAIAKALGDILPCYSLGLNSTFSKDCNPSFAIFNTIQIEGHTDNITVSENWRKREHMIDNYDLSARRSAEMFRSMALRHNPDLLSYKNLKNEPIISFSGYGAMRPLVDNSSPQNRAKNRRIDLRFILATPFEAKEIQNFKKALLDQKPHIRRRVLQ